MSERRDQIAAARALGQAGFDADRTATLLVADVGRWRLPKTYGSSMRRAIGLLAETLQGLAGERLVDRWTAFEQQVWPRWTAGKDRPPLGALWTWGVWAAVCSRAVQPGWPVLSIARVSQWVAKLPADDPLLVSTQRLRAAIDGLRWGSAAYRAAAVTTGTKLLLASGRDDLEELTDGDMRSLPRGIGGADILDMALCGLGIFDRTPLRGTTRHGRTRRLSPAEMVAGSDIAADFQPATTLYLQTYARRISNRYATLQHKLTAIGHFWRYLREHHPDVACCTQVTPAHARGFVPYAIERARTVRRGARISADGEDRLTAHAWLVDVRTFFADICTWGTEPDSPFAGHVPAVVPLTRHDLLDVGFKQARQRREAHVTSLVLDLQREIPNIRAFALRRWHEAQQALADLADDRAAQAAEVTAFWDWALLELLLASGLRVEEACELTTFDILKRQLGDGRVYYLLHVKPSKFDGPGSSRSVTISAASSPRSSATCGPSTAPPRCRRATGATSTRRRRCRVRRTCCREPDTRASSGSAPSGVGCGSCRPPPRPAGPTGRRWCWSPTIAAVPSPPSTSTTTRRSMSSPRCLDTPPWTP
jgi:hypothetical protein